MMICATSGVSSAKRKYLECGEPMTDKVLFVNSIEIDVLLSSEVMF